MLELSRSFIVKVKYLKEIDITKLQKKKLCEL